MEDLIDVLCKHEVKYARKFSSLPRTIRYEDGVVYEIRENLSTVTMTARYMNINAEDFLINPTTEGEIKMKGGVSEFVKTWIFMKNR
jgi:hypothetical protein